MKGLCLVVIVFSVFAQPTEGFFGILEKVVEGGAKIIETGLNVGKEVVEAGVDIGKGIIDAGVQTVGEGIKIGAGVVDFVLDPFNIWKDENDYDHGHSTGKVGQCPAVADIIFVFDASSSMSSKEFEMQKEFAARFTEHFKLGQKYTRFGAIVFSTSVQKAFDLRDYNDHFNLDLAISTVPFLRGLTKTYLALDYLRNSGMFKTTSGARAKSSKIAIVLTDGASDSHSKTVNAATQLKATGVRIISIAIGSSFFSTEVRDIASGSNNAFTVKGFNSLMKIEQSIARRSCEIVEEDMNFPEDIKCPAGFEKSPTTSKCVDIDECTRLKPCQHNCFNMPGAYRCSCKSGWLLSKFDASKCVVRELCHASIDMMFAIDGSLSLSMVSFQEQMAFISKLTENFAIGRDKTKIGAFLFGATISGLFDLGQFSSQQEIANAFRTATLPGGESNLTLALEFILKNRVFEKNCGGRDSASKVVIIFTSSQSSNPSITVEAARKLKEQGIIIITVGIGAKGLQEELTLIASSSEHSFLITQSFLLDYIEQYVVEHACVD